MNISLIILVYIYFRDYRKLIKLAKQTYYSHRLDASTNKQKESWLIVNSIGRENKGPIGSDLDPNEVNNYYCTIAKQLTDKITPANDPLSFLTNTIPIQNSFAFYPTDIFELKKVIMTIRNKNSSGDDQPRYFRTCLTLP